jgi:hypothetical protein
MVDSYDSQEPTFQPVVPLASGCFVIQGVLSKLTENNKDLGLNPVNIVIPIVCFGSQNIHS